MKKQLRECKTQFEIKERLRINAGLIKENNEKEEELLDLIEFTKESLKGMIRQEVQNYFEDTFETDLPIEDEVDEELQKIINELEFEFN
jgi:pyruvate-formate lyase-activating enzyme